MIKRKKIKQRRKWARFRVSDNRKCEAKILQGLDRLSKLESVSLGGCSFLSGRGDARLLLSPEVKVKISIAEESFELQGVVQYCQFQPEYGLDKNIVGIEFVWPDDMTRQEFGLRIGKAVSEGGLEQVNVIEV